MDGNSGLPVIGGVSQVPPDPVSLLLGLDRPTFGVHPGPARY